MAAANTVEHVYELIFEKWLASDEYGAADDTVVESFLDKEISRYATTRPFMAGKTYMDFVIYHDNQTTAEQDREQQELQKIAKTTPDEFWNAA